MRYGAIFPQREIAEDPGAIRAYVEGVQALGYDHLLAYDHVLGADTTNRPGWRGYDINDGFHEIFVLFGYIAAIAPGLELVTDVLVLPQRQTVLAAKQAAEVDILTGGKFRLGVGVGWNAVEYEALGENFRTRGRRIEEQIDVMRRLWTEPVLTYAGTYHRITAAGLTYMPVQRPIPVWMGGTSDIAVERAGRVADGWFPQGLPDETNVRRIALLKESAERAGRDPNAIGIEPYIGLQQGPEVWTEHARRWAEMGSTHGALDTMRAGCATVDDHLRLLEQFRDTVISPR